MFIDVFLNKSVTSIIIFIYIGHKVTKETCIGVITYKSKNEGYTIITTAIAPSWLNYRVIILIRDSGIDE